MSTKRIFDRLKATNPEVTLVYKGFKKTGGKPTGKPALVVGVQKKLARSALSGPLIPQSIDGQVTDVISAPIKALEDQSRYRPAPGGCSVGHYRITAGTLGAWFRSNGKNVVLSNNHVLANSNEASLGDNILQPGPYDGGEFPIARLTDFEQIAFDDGSGVPKPDKGDKGGIPGKSGAARAFWAVAKGVPNGLARLVGCPYRLALRKLSVGAYAEPGQNIMDAAIAEQWDDSSNLVRYDILDIGTITPELADPTVGLEVHKRGRTTEYQTGVITGVDATVQVGYGDNKVATYVDQVVIDKAGFSAGGDSGSLILTKPDNRPVALLFAGGDTITIGSPIKPIFERFGLEFTS